MIDVVSARCLARAAGLTPEARADVEAALRRVDRDFPRLMHALAGDFGVPDRELALRVDAVTFEFAAIQLADDLADGDCDYLEPAHRLGPGAQWLLQHLSRQCLLLSTVERDVLERASQDLIEVGAAQQVEVRVAHWSYPLAAAAALGLNGKQQSAYFRVLAAGTSFSDRAAELGADFGFALHVITDRHGSDRRWSSLGADEQQRLSDDARAAVARAARHELPSLRAPLRWFAAVLDQPLRA